MKTPLEDARCAHAFERRAERADELREHAPAAAEALAFAAGLCRAQARTAGALEDAHRDAHLTGHLERDAERLIAAADVVLRHAADSGPAPLAEHARERLEDDARTARARLLAYWGAERTADEDYLSRAQLRPYASLLRSLDIGLDRPRGRFGCPTCGGRPWVAVRREGSALGGARRVLACALCAGEWTVARIQCPFCAEDNPYALPAFSSNRHPGIRIEACETCRRYVKSIDLAVEPRALPEIDDLASLKLDLWAREQGFERLEPGLAGA